MSSIGPYEVYTDWNYSTNGAFAFATRDGENYFVKKMIAPKYPNKETTSRDTYKKMLSEAETWEKRTRKMHQTLSKASKGCRELVVPVELLREKSTYYIVSPMISDAIDMENLRRMSDSEKVEVFTSVIKGLEALEKNRIVHGDIKMENIMVVNSGGRLEARIFDFEEAYMSGKPPKNDSMGGSVECFSPEQGAYIDSVGSADMITCKTDVFSAGVALYEMLTGDYPGCPAGCTYMAEKDSDIDLSLAPRALQPVLAEMLRLDPTERSSASDIASRMEGVERTAPCTDRKITIVRTRGGMWKVTINGATAIVTTAIAESIARDYGATLEG